ILMAGLQDLIVDAARDRWPTRTGLLLILILTFFTLITIFAGLDLAKVSVAEWSIIGLACAAVWVTWWLTKVPRVARGKVGLGIAIQFEDPSHAKKIRSDL